jgi:hypothetical protein
MNREDIIRMAREASHTPFCYFPQSYAELERFAALVAAAEREACAEICQQQSELQLDERVMRGIDVCKDAIRARGQA